MSGISFHREPENADREFAPLAATQTYDIGDPVYVTGGQLTESPADETIVLDGELVGWALEPARGITAGSRANNADNGFGAATNQTRSYVPAKPGVLMETRNLWLDQAASPPTRTAITGALTGTLHQLVSANDAAAPTNWGLEDTAATEATDATMRVVAVLDDRGNPVAGSAAGTRIVFEAASATTQVAGRT